MSKFALGIDIGGTGIKGGLVNVKSGKIVGDRIRIPTPQGGEPEDIVATVRDIVTALSDDAELPVGVTYPGSIRHGVTTLAANVSKRWLGFEAEKYFEEQIGRPIHFVNDADAAGYAEVIYGAAREQSGLVVVVTLGTGIGTALIYDGVLIPNIELGHIEIEGQDAETFATAVAKERNNLSYEQWSVGLQKYFSQMEMLLSPELFIVGGGISSSHEEFLPLLQLKTPIVPAQLRNKAGILGAAKLAHISK